METIKHNIAVKVIAFILILAISFVTAGAGIVFAVNEEVGTYSKTTNLAAKQIVWETLCESANTVYNETGLSKWEWEEEDVDLDQVKKTFSHSEIFYNEKNLTKFGYAVYPVTKKKAYNTKKPIRIVNEDLSKRINNEDVFVYYSDHELYRIALYMEAPNTPLGKYVTGEVPDEVINTYNYLITCYKCRNVAIGILVAGALAMLTLAIYLIVTMSQEVPHIRRIPLDLAVLVAVIAETAIAEFIASTFTIQSFTYNYMFMGSMTLAVAVFGGIVLLIVARLKQHKWWKSTIIFQCLWLMKKGSVWFVNNFIVNIPLIWKTLIFAVVVIFINLLVVLSQNAGVWFVLSVLFYAFCVIIALALRRLQEGGRRIAAGDLDYQIDTNGLFLDFKQHADNLNSIGHGMELAVAEQMKAERMRSELITNVSHDIKTPLTSIINYVDLLKKEMDGEMNEDKLKEYLEVLDRQSARLKKMADDLIETSKVASGNVKLELAMCNLGMLMNQANSEYQKKAEDAQLNMILSLPKDDVSLMLDGQKMYRVLGNLLSNICKYSQPGTRVYQTLEESEDKITLTYKNTSKYELNISEEELMERFVRGDSSRHTEGSGLGLSIARNLVELQGGRFSIKIDGDLFKVVIEFSK